MQTEQIATAPQASWQKRMGFLDVVIALVLYLVLQVLGGILVFGFVGYVGLSSVKGTLLLLIVVAASTFLSVGITIAVRWRFSFSSIGLRSVSGRWLLAGAGVGLLGYAANYGVVFAYIWLTGDASNPQKDLADAAQGNSLQFMLLLLLGALLIPLAEELLFRGIVYTWLRRWGVALAVGVSAVIFGLAHGVNVVLPAAVLLGVLTALIYEKSGSVWPAVMAHAANNALVFVVVRVLSELG